MKRMLKGLAGFAMMLVLVIGVVGTAFAAGSKEEGVEITSDNAEFIVEDKSGDWTDLTEAEAAKLINAAGGSVQASELKVIWQKEIYAEPSENVNLTFTVDGVKAPQKLYAFLNDWPEVDVWNLVEPKAGVEGNKITATFPHLSPVALVVYTPSGSSDETSPKTGETNALLFIALAAIALGSVTAVVVAKKKA